MKLPEEFTFTDMGKAYPKGTEEIVFTKKQHRRYYDLLTPSEAEVRAFPILLAERSKPYKENDKYYFRGIPVTA